MLMSEAMVWGRVPAVVGWRMVSVTVRGGGLGLLTFIAVEPRHVVI